MAASFQSPVNVALAAADEALALALLAAADEALEEALALPEAAAELDELPPQAARPRQHTHSMVAHSIAKYFFMGSLSLGFPSHAHNTMSHVRFDVRERYMTSCKLNWLS